MMMHDLLILTRKDALETEPEHIHQHVSSIRCALAKDAYIDFSGSVRFKHHAGVDFSCVSFVLSVVIMLCCHKLISSIKFMLDTLF